MKKFKELLGEYETLVKECQEAWHSGTGNVPGTNYAALAYKAQTARKDLVDYFAERMQQSPVEEPPTTGKNGAE